MAWQVIHVRPRCEKRIVQNLAAMRMAYYLPLREECKVYQRRKVRVVKPVFPGYVFAAIEREDRVKVMQTNYVVRLIVPEDETRFLHEIDQVRNALTVDPTLGAGSAVTKGRYVRIVAGPFMGIEGMVAQIRSRCRVYLNVVILGQAAVVEVDRDYLEIID